MTTTTQTPPVKYLSDKKHPTGTPQNGELAEDVEKRFDEQFPGEFTTFEDGMARIETRGVTVKAIKQFIAQELSQSYQRGREEERSDIMERLRAVDTIAEDEQKHKWTEHCSCLRYAIWRVENPDADEMVYASRLSEPNKAKD